MFSGHSLYAENVLLFMLVPYKYDCMAADMLTWLSSHVSYLMVMFDFSVSLLWSNFISYAVVSSSYCSNVG
jgi:hypothetical protein